MVVNYTGKSFQTSGERLSNYFKTLLKTIKLFAKFFQIVNPIVKPDRVIEVQTLLIRK
jgi:hypothetical protein